MMGNGVLLVSLGEITTNTNFDEARTWSAIGRAEDSYADNYFGDTDL